MSSKNWKENLRLIITEKKNSTTLKIGCFYPNMVREDLRHALTCVSGSEMHDYACIMSSPTRFWLKN